MRVCFVHDHLFTHKNDQYYSGGGLPTSVIEQYVGFDSIDELVIVGRYDFSSRGTVLASTKDVRFSLIKNYRNIIDLVISYKKVLKDIEHEIKQADCVILRLPSILGFMAYKLCCKHDKPFFIEVVADAYDSFYYHSLLGRIVAFPLCSLTKYIVRNAQFVLYVTQRYLQNKYPSYNNTLGCSDVNIKPMSNKVLLARLSGIDRLAVNTIICGQIGNLNSKYKGYHVMFKAIKELSSKGVNVVYRIAGGGNQAKILEIARSYDVQDSVVLFGMLDREEIQKFLAEIDIYVHPSFTEGLPRSVVEALAFGCPILASNVGGIPELVDVDYLHIPGDYSKLVSHLLLVMNDKEKMKVMAKTNFEKAKEYYVDVLLSKRNMFFDKFYSRVKDNM